MKKTQVEIWTLRRIPKRPKTPISGVRRQTPKIPGVIFLSQEDVSNMSTDIFYTFIQFTQVENILLLSFFAHRTYFLPFEFYNMNLVFWVLDF